MGALIVTIIAINGYVALRNHYPTKYQLSRSTHWKAYFKMWVVGLMIIGATTILAVAIDLGDVARDWMSSAGFRFYHAKELGLSFLQIKILIILGCSLLAAFAIDITYKIFWLSEKRKHNWILNLNLNRLDILEEAAVTVAQENLALTSSSFDELVQLMVTLKNNKVYIGQCILPPLDEGHPSFITIIPTYSGYRNKDTLELEITTRYADHYKKHDNYKEDTYQVVGRFKIWIPREEIASISLFDSHSFAALSRQDLASW